MTKILIAEDDDHTRDALREVLTMEGHEVIAASDGLQAVDFFRAESPDFVCLDVMMPGLNGYQATRTLTRDEDTKGIPVIVCTSKGQETDKIWGLRQGAIDYLVKPLNPEELLQRIAALP